MTSHGPDDRSLDAALVQSFGHASAPVTVASAPGRVNLIGGHTDYNGGFALPFGIDRRHWVALRPREDRILAVRSENFDETHRCSLDELEPATERHWADYVKGVASVLQEHGHELQGMELVVDGRVPIQAGCSSSAAFEVALAMAMDAAFSLGLEPMTIVRHARAAETEFVGVSCGIMDQYTSVYAEPERALFIDCQELYHEVVPLPSTEVAVVATDSCVQRGLIDSAYNDRVVTCTQAAGRFNDRLDREVRSLRDVRARDLDSIGSELSPIARKRVRHVVTENDRVCNAREALAEHDFDELGQLLERSHASLRDDYEVSIDELDAVVEIAADVDGVYGSRMTGGGFGGSVITLVDPDAVSRVRSRIEAEYTARTGIDPDTYVFTAGDGARVDDQG